MAATPASNIVRSQVQRILSIRWLCSTGLIVTARKMAFFKSSRSFGFTSIALPSSATAPHVSVLAGILAAAEIYEISVGLPAINRRLDMDLSSLPQDTSVDRQQT